MLSAGAGWRRPEIRETAIDPVAVALVLVAAVVHASWNRVLHAEDDRVAAMAVAGLVVGVMLLPAVIVSPPWRALPFVIASATAHVAYALGSVRGVPARSALGRLSPRSRRRPAARHARWLAAPVGTAGRGSADRGDLARGRAGADRGRRRACRTGAAVGFALLTGLTIAAYSVVDAGAVRQVSPVGYLGAVLGIQGVLLTLLVGEPHQAATRPALRCPDRGGLGRRIPAGALCLPVGAGGAGLDAARGLGAGRSNALWRATVASSLDRRHPRPGRRAARRELKVTRESRVILSPQAKNLGVREQMRDGAEILRSSG